MRGFIWTIYILAKSLTGGLNRVLRIQSLSYMKLHSTEHESINIGQYRLILDSSYGSNTILHLVWFVRNGKNWYILNKQWVLNIRQISNRLAIWVLKFQGKISNLSTGHFRPHCLYFILSVNLFVFYTKIEGKRSSVWLILK